MAKIAPPHNKFWLGLGLGALSGYLGFQQAWSLRRLMQVDVPQALAQHANQGPKGSRLVIGRETEKFTMRHTIEDGIERITYRPRQPRFETPILMQHGMWHGAWCWKSWQELLAAWGWESHAYSLPGHAGSPEQRPIAACTLDYYLGFLKAEVERLPRKPVLMGHSMGGALTQWYLKYVGDDLPAAVLVAPWGAHNLMADGGLRVITRDPLVVPLVMKTWDATPFVRTPYSTGRLLLGQGAVISPEELHARLGPESALVMMQHRPPFWSPPSPVRTPMLLLAGEADAGIPEPCLRRSAAFYRADYVVVEAAGHNLMMEHNYQQTAHIIHTWLLEHIH